MSLELAGLLVGLLSKGCWTGEGDPSGLLIGWNLIMGGLGWLDLGLCQESTASSFFFFYYYVVWMDRYMRLYTCTWFVVFFILDCMELEYVCMMMYAA